MIKFLKEKIDDYQNTLFFEINKKKIIKDICKNKKNFFFENVNKKFSFIYIQKAKWESEILKKKCCKINIVYSNDEYLLNKVFNKVDKILKQNYWIQFDSQNQEQHIDNFFLKKKFKISNTYYQWEVNPKYLNKNFLIKKNYFKIRVSLKKDVNLIVNFFKKNPSPGRFYNDTNIKKYSGDLYASWISNILKNKNKENFVLLSEQNRVIIGAQGFSCRNSIANLDILRVTEPLKNSGLGYSILSYGISKILQNNRIKLLRTRTSKFNYKINNILKKLGFKIIGSGINFSKINE